MEKTGDPTPKPSPAALQNSPDGELFVAMIFCGIFLKKRKKVLALLEGMCYYDKQQSVPLEL